MVKKFGMTSTSSTKKKVTKIVPLKKAKRREEEDEAPASGKREKMRVNSFDKEMAELATKQASANKATSGAQFVSTAGGEFSIDDEVVKSGKITCVIVDSLHVNTYYEGAYVPNKPTSPDCYAYGEVEEGMEPHEDCSEPQSESCADCPLNVFGSGQGKAKACKNQRRLALILEEDMEEGTGRVLMLNVSPSSITEFAIYVQGVTKAYKRPTAGVLTEIEIVRPKGKTYGELYFTFVRELKSSELKFVLPRIDEAKALLSVPYPKFDEEEEEEKPTRKAKSKPSRSSKPSSREEKPRKFLRRK